MVGRRSSSHQRQTRRQHKRNFSTNATNKNERRRRRRRRILSILQWRSNLNLFVVFLCFFLFYIGFIDRQLVKLAVRELIIVDLKASSSSSTSSSLEIVGHGRKVTRAASINGRLTCVPTVEIDWNLLCDCVCCHNKRFGMGRDSLLKQSDSIRSLVGLSLTAVYLHTGRQLTSSRQVKGRLCLSSLVCPVFIFVGHSPTSPVGQFISSSIDATVKTPMVQKDPQCPSLMLGREYYDCASQLFSAPSISAQHR